MNQNLLISNYLNLFISMLVDSILSFYSYPSTFIYPSIYLSILYFKWQGTIYSINGKPQI